MISPITTILNHLSDTAIKGAFSGGVGYLCARAIKQIDPRVGFVCGATIAVLAGLFAAEGSNTASKILAIASFHFVPFKICQKLELPATFKNVFIVSYASLVSLFVAQGLLNLYEDME